MDSSIDISLLDGIIVGRVVPNIYAFSTDMIPNYLKIGDTYRPVSVRLDEWGTHYKNIVKEYVHTAMLESGCIFRDYAVHYYLEAEKQFHRLQRDEIEKGIYYSQEFFKDVSPSDVEEAIADIVRSEREQDGKYQFYTADRLPTETTYKRDKDFPPREIQQKAIDKLLEAKERGRRNLLMYAVMRFGKSFTAMCCATAMKARFVLIVSAKDVCSEWEETVCSHQRFEGYTFMNAKKLQNDDHLLTNTLQSGNNVALYLTLQDLQGGDIKQKHKEVFKNKIDLLIIDETHFGARAEELGRVLDEAGLNTKEKYKETKGVIDTDKIYERLKKLRADIRLHLSGTPYRVLMSSEFAEEDIVAFCQYTDIIDEKEKWDEEHKDAPEWDNPYYGFPQMIRFAFNPNASSKRIMDEMKEEGKAFALSALFQPVSISKDKGGRHKKFIHEKEVLELLEVIDGSRTDENLLGFLDYDKIKGGKMCRHIVCVLPFRASCDALETLIKKNVRRFKNLNQYAIVNIAGVEDERTYKDTRKVKAKIRRCELNDQKTITLTVNKMLTGSTVEYWDTMFFLKDTSSPQEYDQAIFRIQSPYIQTYKDPQGNIIKYDMKPQTLLVDFDPYRMFSMQELKSQFFNASKNKNGNEELGNRIRRELQISPIITLNKHLLKQVDERDVMKVVQQYSRDKSIMDESRELPFDFSLLDDDSFRKEIESLAEIDAAKGLEFSPNEGDAEDDYKIPMEENTHSSQPEPSDTSKQGTKPEDEKESLLKKYRAYCAKLLFYAYLTDSEMTSLKGIIDSIAGGDRENRRIAKNLGIKVPILCHLQKNCDTFILSKLDYKIANINKLMHDESLTPIDRAHNAMKRFTRVSDSEIVTPSFITKQMVDLLPEDFMKGKPRILDLATVEGELICAVHEKYGREVAMNFYSVPTSALSYELTLKMYKLLQLPTEHVKKYYSYSLINEPGKAYVEELKKEKYDAVISVPPFRERVGGGRGDGGSAIYHLFFNLAKDELSPKYIAMMTQSTWYTGGKGAKLNEFRDYMLTDTEGERHIREFHDYPNIETYIKGATTLRGGICLFLWDKDYDGLTQFVNHFNHKDVALLRNLRYTKETFRSDFLIRWNQGLAILEKVISKETSFLPDNNLMRRRNPFGFPNKSSDDWLLDKKRTKTRKTKVFLAKGKFGYAKDNDFKKEHEGLLKRWKVLVAKSSSGGDDIPHLVISQPIVSPPGTATANTHYVIEGVDCKAEAENLANYMRTKFFRFMVYLLRSNQNMRVDMYQFVPRLDFTRSWSDEQLYKRYGLSKEEREFINSVIKDMKKSNV